jgi:hypothetical protein
MARKINPSKLSRQNHAEVQMMNRRPGSPAGALYLMQLRAQSLKISPPHRTRLEIQAEPDTETAQPVKIIWID